MGETDKLRRVLAVASSGGHWVELLRLGPAFTNHEIVFVTVMKSYRSASAGKQILPRKRCQSPEQVQINLVSNPGSQSCMDCRRGKTGFRDFHRRFPWILCRAFRTSAWGENNLGR